MKKINRCPDGGFVKLKSMVLQGGKPQCPACCEILEENDFKYEDLQKAVDALKAGLPAPVERGVRKYVFTKRKMEGKAAAKRRQGKGKKNGKNKEDEEKEDKENKDEKEGKEQCGLADPVGDSLEVAKQFEPDIILLPRGSYRKLVPYRCLLCRTRRQPEGKVGECKAMKPYMIRHFLTNHLNSLTHQRNLQEREKRSMNTDSRKVVKCEAISLGAPGPGSSLHSCAKEFGLWARYANLEDTARHSYWFDASEGCWIIRANGCKEEVEENCKAQRQVCTACMNLLKSHSIVRSCIRFAVKYYASMMSHARIFQGSEEVEALKAEIEALPSFQNDKRNFKALLELDTGKLQQYVGASFVCDASCSPVLKD